MSFGDDRSEATAAEVPTHLRNEAERARAITTFGDLYKRIVRRRGQHAWRRFVVEIRRALIADRHDRKQARVGFGIANGEDVVDLIGADESIDFGNLRLQLVSITLNKQPATMSRLA